MSILVISSLTKLLALTTKLDLGFGIEIGREGVLALLSGLQQMRQVLNKTASEAEVGQEDSTKLLPMQMDVLLLLQLPSNLVRIQQVFDSAAEHGRRVVLTGFDVGKYCSYSYPS